MARTASTDLKTATARMRLAPRAKPYCTTLEARKRLGYIRQAVGAGNWLALVEIGRTATGSAIVRQGNLGVADDIAGAKGERILSYSAALTAAQLWQPGGAALGALTVRAAVESYVSSRRAKKGDEAAEDASDRLRHNFLREDKSGKAFPGVRGFGERAISSLTLGELREWRDAMVNRADSPLKRATANRVIANVKAFLNHAFADEANGIETDKAWRMLEKFEDADVKREDFFTEAEVARLIRAARRQDPAFANLLAAGYYTGARYGELRHLDVRHLNARTRLLHIPRGKTGPRDVTLADQGAEFFAGIAKGRAPSEPLLLTAEGERWAPGMQQARMRDALAAAKLSETAVFYAIRHSYISHSILAGAPLAMLAENLGTSVGMIERFYFHLLADKRRAIVQATAPRLTA